MWLNVKERDRHTDQNMLQTVKKHLDLAVDVDVYKFTWLQVKAHMEALQVENDHLSREIAILRETVKVITTLRTLRTLSVETRGRQKYFGNP